MMCHFYLAAGTLRAAPSQRAPPWADMSGSGALWSPRLLFLWWTIIFTKADADYRRNQMRV